MQADKQWYIKIWLPRNHKQNIVLKRGLIARFFLAEKRVNLSTVLVGG